MNVEVMCFKAGTEEREEAILYHKSILDDISKERQRDTHSYTERKQGVYLGQREGISQYQYRAGLH